MVQETWRITMSTKEIPPRPEIVKKVEVPPSPPVDKKPKIEYDLGEINRPEVVFVVISQASFDPDNLLVEKVFGADAQEEDLKKQYEAWPNPNQTGARIGANRISKVYTREEALEKFNFIK